MKKKKSAKRKITVILSALGAYIVSNIVCLIVRNVKLSRKLKTCENKNNMSNSLFLGLSNIEMGEETDNAYFTCLSGGYNISFSAASVKEEIYIDIFAILGRIKITVPEDVKVINETDGHFYVTNYNIADPDEPKAVVHLTGKNYLSYITLKNE